MTPHLTNAMDIFVVANDARFLFKKLRRSPEADRLAASRTTDELLQWLSEHAKSAPATVEDLVQSYLHLVAVDLQGETAVARLRPSHIPQVQWGSQFVDLMRAPKAETSRSRLVIDKFSFTVPSQQHETPDKRERYLQVRISDEEKATFDEAAARSGLELSQWVRMTLLTSARSGK